MTLCAPGRPVAQAPRWERPRAVLGQWRWRSGSTRPFPAEAAGVWVIPAPPAVPSPAHFLPAHRGEQAAAACVGSTGKFPRIPGGCLIAKGNVEVQIEIIQDGPSGSSQGEDLSLVRGWGKHTKEWSLRNASLEKGEGVALPRRQRGSRVERGQGYLLTPSS